MAITICDIEADGFLDVVTKIHCISVYYQDSDGKWCIKSTTDYEEMRRYFLKENQTIVMHYGVCYDIPVVELILGIKLPKSVSIIDSCAVSFVLFPERTRKKIGHSLESFGVDFGVPKKPIDDWENLPVTEYIERCEQDIRINLRLWLDQWDYLCNIYNGDFVTIKKFLAYLTFKMECLRDQERIKVKIDLNTLEENFQYFTKLREDKIKELQQAMPKRPVISKKKPPAGGLYKKDGSLSVSGESWLEVLKLNGLPEDYQGEVNHVVSWEEPNPQSVDQVKDWLYSMSWEPQTFEARKNSKGEVKEVPQINIKERLCPSVELLIAKDPAVELLAGLGIIKHRLGILKSFQKNHKDGYVIAGASAFTNSLRYQHISPIANLPKYTGDKDIKDGFYIRGIIVAPEGYEICGADVMSLEDRVKQCLIYDYDEQYVKDMMTPDFDPHLDLAVSAGALTLEQANAHKKGEANYKTERHVYKTGNYSCQFGAGAAKIAKTLGLTVSEGKKIHAAYWKRNKAIKEVERDSKVITVRDQMWLLNPLNGFYYSLRNTKDIFSLLCQGGGVYIFDKWLYNMRIKGIVPALQYHDEKMSYNVKNEEERQRIKKIIKDSMMSVNTELALKREMDVDVQFGETYASVH